MLRGKLLWISLLLLLIGSGCAPKVQDIEIRQVYKYVKAPEAQPFVPMAYPNMEYLCAPENAPAILYNDAGIKKEIEDLWTEVKFYRSQVKE